jgi:hypothetical protein
MRGAEAYFLSSLVPHSEIYLMKSNLRFNEGGIVISGIQR